MEDSKIVEKRRVTGKDFDTIAEFIVEERDRRRVARKDKEKQWKEIGPVPRRDSDKLWKRFRASCDTFFNNKSKYFEDIDSTFEDNLKTKEGLVEEMNRFTPQDEHLAPDQS